MKNIIIGQYIPGTSFLYKADPRSKILALVILMIATFILVDIWQIVVLLGIVLFILIIGGISVGRVFRGLKPIMVLLMFTFVFQLLFVNTGEVYLDETLNITLYNLLIAVGIFLFWFFTKQFIKFKVLYFLVMFLGILTLFTLYQPGTVLTSSNLTIYEGGVYGALFIMTRLIIIVMMSTILTLTTKPTDLTLGLEQLMKPLHIIKVNAEELAMIISIALRYIPTLLDEANKIMLAQASRGVDFSEGKLKDKVMQIISLLVPMFIISFKRSDELANAMEARNFVPGKKRTRLHVLTWGVIDNVVMVFVVLIFAGAILAITL